MRSGTHGRTRRTSGRGSVGGEGRARSARWCRFLERALELASTTFRLFEQHLDAPGTRPFARELGIEARLQAPELRPPYPELERKRPGDGEQRDQTRRTEQPLRGPRPLGRVKGGQPELVLALPRGELDLAPESRFRGDALDLGTPDPFEPCLLFAPELFRAKRRSSNLGCTTRFVFRAPCHFGSVAFRFESALRLGLPPLVGDALALVREQ